MAAISKSLFYCGLICGIFYLVDGNIGDIYKSCKESKSTCFGMPNNCYRKSSPSCAVLASVVKMGQKFRFKLARLGRVDDFKYVAIGITEQGGMIKASIATCKVVGGRVSLSVHWSDSKTYPPEIGDHPYIQEVKGEMRDGSLICEFDRDANSEIQQNEFNLDEKAYAFILAKGDWDVADSKLKFHGGAPGDRFSSQPVKIIGSNAMKCQANFWIFAPLSIISYAVLI